MSYLGLNQNSAQESMAMSDGCELTLRKSLTRKILDTCQKYDKPGQVCFCKQRKLFNCQNRQKPCPLVAFVFLMQRSKFFQDLIDGIVNEVKYNYQ